MLSQNTALWLRQKWMQARRLPKAFVSSAGILNLPITSLPVDNFKDRALWCKPTGINYNMHGWILCRYWATGWFWWISGLRAVTMWSSASFTKTNGTRHDQSYCQFILLMNNSMLFVRQKLFVWKHERVCGKTNLNNDAHCYYKLTLKLSR